MKRPFPRTPRPSSDSEPTGIALRRDTLARRDSSEPERLWEPPASPAPAAAHALELAPEIDEAALRILASPLVDRESYLANAVRRERELGQLFATLDVIQSHHLGGRLDRRHTDDALAMAFHQRLTPDRRNRLRAILAEARRRAARR
jgi:hypothetical protein